MLSNYRQCSYVLLLNLASSHCFHFVHDYLKSKGITLPIHLYQRKKLTKCLKGSSNWRLFGQTKSESLWDGLVEKKLRGTKTKEWVLPEEYRFKVCTTGYAGCWDSARSDRVKIHPIIFFLVFYEWALNKLHFNI